MDAIRYRQQILADCLKHPAVVRALYQLAVKGVETKRDARFYWFRDSPDSVLQKSIGMLGLLADGLGQVRQLADENASRFDSEGFTRLFTALRQKLDEEYLQAVADHLHALRFRRGALMSASLGRANRGTNYVLRKPEERTLLERITPSGQASYSFTVGERDEYGMQALADLRGRGIGLVANALAQSTDHVLGFFGLLRAELGFYVGLPQPARPARRTRYRHLLPRSSRAARGRRLRRRTPRHRARLSPPTPSSRKRRRRRPQTARHRHRRQPGRQDDLPSQRWPRRN